ncbi:MAG: HD domain-containing protein [Firmicutes bacterium]|jgi:HD-GYP domain-containing protein (c-di-GMP phosphodiesterase class II)|nr:HD domain-containing protein [Bacillota bacterium]
MRIDLVQTLLTLSSSLDYAYRGMTDHHHIVTLAALTVGRALDMAENDLSELFKAAIVHDIGAVTWREKESLHEFEVENTKPHCRRGRDFITGSRFLTSAADVLLHHHDRWSGGDPGGLRGDEIPLASRIILVADRLAVLVREGEHILVQREAILDRIGSLAGTVLDPGLVDAVREVARPESFWLDLAGPWRMDRILGLVPALQVQGDSEDLFELAQVLATVVDAKSPFTYRHSQGVAVASRFLADVFGLEGDKLRTLETAGLLHDLGKLTVPDEILEKPGPLTADEMDWMRQHAYYTYWLVHPISPHPEIAEWAAFHHERLDGRGYPFGKTGEDLELEHRILCVADIFTALREDRPYRTSLPWAEIETILSRQVRSGGLDQDVVAALLAESDALDDIWADLSARLAHLCAAAP